MKKITRYFLASLLLVSLIGCNENTNTATDKKSETIKVSIVTPSENSKGDEKGFFKSFTTDIQSVLLQVFKQARTVDGVEVAAEKLQTKSMTKNAKGIWLIDLVLNSDDAPFEFKALAYQTLVTSATETANTPIFTGETPTVTDNKAVIVLTETDESISESTRKLPTLDSVASVIDSTDSSIELTFNLTYATGGTVTYALSSVANDGAGAICTTSLFTPSTGTINFDSATSFTSTLTLDDATCDNPKHFILLTTPTSDTLKVPFTVDANSLAVNIALPAVISNINVVDNGTSFDLDVVVKNSDTLTLSYAWSVVKGTGTFDTQTAQTNLSGFDRANALVVLIAVTNDKTGAVSSIRYELVAPLAKYTRDDTSKIVTDNETKLEWKDDAIGSKRNWQGATDYCESLSFANYDDWRVPTKDELVGIVDTNYDKPAINPIFQNTKSNYYWSSTNYLNNNGYVWLVNFHNGGQYNNSKYYNFYLRCVRTGQ